MVVVLVQIVLMIYVTKMILYYLCIYYEYTTPNSPPCPDTVSADEGGAEAVVVARPVLASAW